MKPGQILLLLVLVLTMACQKEDEGPRHTTFELHIDFWNPTGNDPEIRFDAQSSSPEVRIDFSKTFGGFAVPPNLTNVVIDNVRLIGNDNVNYEIEEITAYEFRDDINDWKEDVEFTMSYELIEDLDVVLVLDASASLGDDFETVKAFANDFIDSVFAASPSAEIGLVSFSDLIDYLPLTNDQNQLKTYIDSIQQGPFTSLYEAINMGIDLLQESEAEGKAVVTFTDGTDNNSAPQYTPGFLFDKLTQDTSNIKVNSFTIGFEGNGGVDRPVLETLAANGGVAVFPNTIDEVGQVFGSFSNSIANVYNLTYVRNQQVIPENDPARLRFVIQSSRK
jgi:Mg-chelatase subunit ChlD